MVVHLILPNCDPTYVLCIVFASTVNLFREIFVSGFIAFNARVIGAAKKSDRRGFDCVKFLWDGPVAVRAVLVWPAQLTGPKRSTWLVTEYAAVAEPAAVAAIMICSLSIVLTVPSANDLSQP